MNIQKTNSQVYAAIYFIISYKTLWTEFNCIYVLSFEFSQNEYEFISRLLKLEKVRTYLEVCWLTVPKLSQALSILSLLSDYMSITSVVLSYLDCNDTADPSIAIQSSKVWFTKKVGIISKLQISKIVTNF